MKNLLFGAVMLIWTFAFANSSVEITEVVKSENAIELLNVNFGDFEVDALDSNLVVVGCQSSVFVYKRNKNGTKTLLHSFTYYDEDCDADYQMEIVYI